MKTAKGICCHVGLNTFNDQVKDADSFLKLPADLASVEQALSLG